MGGSLGEALSPEARDQALATAAHALSAELVVYGQSAQGRPLVAARVPSHGAAGAPRVLLLANIHGVEFAGVHAALELLEQLRAGRAAEALRNRADVWVIPSANPDAYARTWEANGVGTMAQLRTNAHGVDLNRNFPRPHQAPPSRLPFTGSNEPGAATYRGAAPLSEPETRALDALMTTHRFHAVLSLHSFMGTLIHARVTDRVAYAEYGRLCASFRSAQRKAPYRRMGSRWLDAYTGELEDHAHHAHGAWAMCVEMFPVWNALRQGLREDALFWKMNPRDLRAWVQNDVPGMVAYFHAALDLPPPVEIPMLHA